MNEIQLFLQTKQEEMLETLRVLVEYESPSSSKPLNDTIGRHIAQLFTELTGGTVEIIPSDKQGDNVRCEWGTGEGKPILLIGHFDTVWPEGELRTMPFRVEDGKAYGPGIYDMKAGLVQGIFALHALHTLGKQLNRRIVFLFNSDEEIGSPSSRELIEREAQQSELVLVLEPGPSIITFRKGIGIFKIKATGRASHSGAAHAAGLSAIEEMARQVLYLHGLTDYEKGTTLNVGTIHGGTAFNVVAAQAEAEMDLRIESMEEAERLLPLIQGIEPHKAGVSLEVTGGLNRPPMVRTERNVQLYERVKQLAHDSFQLELAERRAGGFSDANLTSAFAPTIDGLGAVGGGAHAIDEHIVIAEMPIRSALLSMLIESLCANPIRFES
ncbi:M20 family metallopeptidase [Paenibacillus koleovorans]|uniref:M20 family metallopeptidase n=1 Tax=Paenibacillus koleovorans TaxID=121608 RepID=UPI000FDA9F95|nr:M20 family metallopeptidase [Paenibacillus koleovorans]